MPNQEIVFTEEIFYGLRNARISIVRCWAPWCAACRDAEEIISVLADRLGGNCNFYALNIDRKLSLSQQLGVRYLPETLIYLGGDLQARLVGEIDVEQVMAVLPGYAHTCSFDKQQAGYV